MVFCRLLDVFPARNFPNRTTAQLMFNELILRGLAKTFKLATFHAESSSCHRSCCLSCLAAEYVCNASLLELSSWRAVKTSHRAANDAGVWVGVRTFALLLRSCVCVCVAFAITGWVVSRNNNFNRAQTTRIKLNSQTSHDTGICRNVSITMHLSKT